MASENPSFAHHAHRFRSPASVEADATEAIARLGRGDPEGIALADDVHSVTVDHQFRGTRTRVVVGTHRERIGAGGADGQQVAGLHDQLAATAEEVGGLADRTDDVDDP